MSETPTPARTRGIHHAGLTVPDLARTQRFFEETLGFRSVGGDASYPSVFLSDGRVMVTLWQAADPERARPFDRRQNVGLHHLALQVEDAEALSELHAELVRRGDVEIEFAPEPLGGGPTRHLMCAIPGGVRIELIAPAAG